MDLVNRLVRQFERAFNALLSVTFTSQFWYCVLLAEYIQDIPDEVMMLGLPIRLSSTMLPTSSECFDYVCLFDVVNIH